LRDIFDHGADLSHGAPITKELKQRASFHASKAATIQRMIKSAHNPLANHPGIPANPQDTSKAPTTARMSIVTAHDNIDHQLDGLKHAREDAVA
jgi:hypothetical protein